MFVFWIAIWLKYNSQISEKTPVPCIFVVKKNPSEKNCICRTIWTDAAVSENQTLFFSLALDK